MMNNYEGEEVSPDYLKVKISQNLSLNSPVASEIDDEVE